MKLLGYQGHKTFLLQKKLSKERLFVFVANALFDCLFLFFVNCLLADCSLRCLFSHRYLAKSHGALWRRNTHFGSPVVGSKLKTFKMLCKQDFKG